MDLKNTQKNKHRASNYNSFHQKLFLSINSEISPLDLYNILKKNPYLVNTEDENNETFLSYAIKRNNNSLINLILTSPILNLTYQNEQGNTYLHLAVVQQNIKLVQKLIDKGIFIDIQNNDGNTALHLAYYINNLELIKLLINNNIDFGIKNKKGLIAEEIDPIDNINDIAGYEVDMNFNGGDYELNDLSLNKNEEKLKIQKIDSENSGETKYKSQFSKEKRNFFNNKKDLEMKSFNDNKGKYKNISLKIEDNNKNNKIIYKNFSGNDVTHKNNDNLRIIKNTIKKISDNEGRNNNLNDDINSEKDVDNLKTIDNNNNFPLYEEPMDPSQDFAESILDSSKKNNLSNFLDNNELNISNNNIYNTDNNSIQANEFFKGGKNTNSIISNIPIKNDEIKNKNKADIKNIKKEKIINCKNKPLFEFLQQIYMQKYYDNLNNNGFEYINMIIDDTKVGNYLTDKQLKMIGITVPGDRAKILIRFEEKANMFEFTIPKSVYYISNNLEHIEDDLNVCKLNAWLRNIRLEQYIKNFILNGYFSLDLLLVQSISKNPLTDEILKDEFGIEKLGHRARILNKLKEESKYFVNKLRDSIMSYQIEENSKICSECIIC